MTKKNCPNCNSDNCAEILYGYTLITKDLDLAIKQQKIILGGCVLYGNDPKWQCNKCYTRWN